MFRIAPILSVIVLLAACGEDQQAPKPQTSAAPAPAAATSTPPAAPAAPAAAPAMAAADDEIKYDPIDVAKLDAKWWQQYSAGE